jgi:hypothetical protein
VSELAFSAIATSHLASKSSTTRFHQEDAGVPVEKIAELVGHKGGSTVTEKVYRKQIRPVITKGAEVMDRIFPDAPREATSTGSADA